MRCMIGCLQAVLRDVVAAEDLDYLAAVERLASEIRQAAVERWWYLELEAEKGTSQ